LVIAVVCNCAWGAPQQTERDSATASAVAMILEHEHVAPRPIDDELSRQWLDAYLDALDPNHMILLAGDVTELQKRWSKVLDDDVEKREPKLEAMSEVYARYERRLGERLAGARKTLAGPLPLDGQDTWDTERKDAPWPATAAEADDQWRRMILDQALRAVLLAELSKPDPAATTPPPSPEERRETALADLRTRLGKRFDRMAESLAKTSEADVLEFYLDALTTLFDPHSEYFAPATNSNFNIEVNNAVEGIGARLRYEDDYTVVEDVLPGGPAAMDGRLRPGDRIVGVAQGEAPFVDIVGMRLDDVVALIRGHKGTTVRLMVLPVDAPSRADTQVLSIVRAEVVIEESRARAAVLDAPPGAPVVGVIELPSFYSDMNSDEAAGKRRGATTDVAARIAELQSKHVDGIILDLRDNGGGSLREAIDLTGLFIDQGPVVQVRGGDGKVEVLSDDSAGEAWSGPLVVLTSPLSASASEIVAGALQDYGRAIVIGAETTHGKGSVQQVLDLSPFLERMYGQAATENSDSLKITTQQFYRVTGSSTQSKGVLSDIVLPSPWQGLPVYESDMPHALPWSQIAPATFKPSGALAATIPALKQRSAERVAASADFADLQKRLAERDKARAEKVISLNLDKRRAALQAAGVQDLSDDADEDAPKGEKEARDLAADFVLQEAAAVLREEIGAKR